MPQIICLGEALIDLFASPGVALPEADALTARPGGAPANVAVALARLGASVGFIGKVGADEWGAFLISLLASEGVDTRHFVADAGAPTMLAVVSAPSPTEQHFVLYHGADTCLQLGDLDPEFIRSANVLVYGSVTLTEASGPAALQAARWAYEAGNEVIFDVNLRPTLWPDLATARDEILNALESATVVKLNETELEFLTGVAEPELGSQRLLKRGVPLCCVSLGADGSYYANAVASGQVPAFRVQVADTTGSGDAFVAGLALGLSKHPGSAGRLSREALASMLRFANACGALAATEMGAMSALPSRAAVERLLLKGGS